ncbi:MAG: N-acetyl sugar amidotransferase [Alphaproteobacteria bacterium]|nr:N-acetyl sugar amidotransferase [Alphaproteobacteria bacterium]
MTSAVARPYQVCVRCVMDTSDPAIAFDERGVCNHCRGYDAALARLPPPGERPAALASLLDRIRRRGRGRDYDCVLGLSGGVDSTFLALKAKQWGLRPLAVHFDSGWNSEIAVGNIERTVKRLGFDLITEVCDWPEMRDLQRAYLKASVLDADVPQDHAFIAVLFRAAARAGIGTILSGHNLQTELVLPDDWVHAPGDWINLRAIHRAHGQAPLRRFPVMSLFERLWRERVQGIRFERPLSLIDYDQKTAMAEIAAELGWVYYGGKHWESVFTRFFQTYYLPRKFGIDKRRAHLANLVAAGQVTRDQALAELGRNLGAGDEPADVANYVRKKLGFDEEELARIMAAPRRSHHGFATWDGYRRPLLRLRRLLGGETRAA